MKERFSIDFEYHFYPDEYDNRLPLIKQAGFNQVSFSASGLPDFADEKILYHFTAQAYKYGLRTINYHPYFAKNNLLWVDCPEREEVVAANIRAIYACGKLGIDSIIIHPTSGVNNLLVSGAGLESFKEILSSAEENGVDVCLENLRTHRHTDFLYGNIESPRLKFCHDAGHEFAFCKGMEFPRRYADKMAFTHLHDNDGINDQHKLPLDGEIDYNGYAIMLKDVNYQGPLNLEVAPKDNNYNGMNFENYCQEGYNRLLAVFGE